MVGRVEERGCESVPGEINGPVDEVEEHEEGGEADTTELVYVADTVELGGDVVELVGLVLHTATQTHHEPDEERVHVLKGGQVLTLSPCLLLFHGEVVLLHRLVTRLTLTHQSGPLRRRCFQLQNIAKLIRSTKFRNNKNIR